MDCPLCGKKFTDEAIMAHVNQCLDSPAPTTPAVQPVVVVQPTPTQPTTGGTEVDEQMEAYRYWIERKKQEEEDMRMAMELENTTTSTTPTTPQKPVVTTPQKPTPTTPTRQPTAEESSLELALRLQEEDRKAARAKADSDRRLAEELWRKEEEAEAERRKKKEWEETLALVKQSVKADADRELAEAMRAKAALAAQLEALRQEEQASGGVHVAVNVDNIEYPATWQHQTKDFQTFSVHKGTEEWHDVETQFLQTIGSSMFTVTKIERHQNKTGWQFYFLRREQVANRNSKYPNERFLYHGSRSNAYDQIITEGFDHRVANMGGAIGAGVYFATHSLTSTGYVADKGYRGDKKMLYCRVTLGSVGVGQSGMRRPPDRGAGQGIHDSVGQVSGGSGMYVVFDNHQAYPEYSIYYR
eukprot:TRINITY_DN5746_c0_g1_i1.p1 TRINITY_DN5746_c0_g1~~TRINITY_DN5746_c0_g1_i1.p1  ORF type:complete len:414 (+),score=90.61 TRINITY_DN5746_c0_g1_i1:138-1379(+)